MAADYFNSLISLLPDSPGYGALVEACAGILKQHDLHYGHGTTNADDEAYALVFDLLDLPYEDTDAYWHKPVSNDEIRQLAKALDKRITERIPVPYITGRAWFAGLPFAIDDRALIPRSPIAELIEQAFSPWIELPEHPRILDLCAGSGCIGIAAAVHLPQAEVDLVDISNCALILAQRNIEQHRVEDRVRIIQSDLFEAIGDQQYDIIVTNPPYVPLSSLQALPKEYTHEPTLALEAQDDGMQIVDRILKDSANYLKNNGILIAEVGEIQHTVDQRYNALPLTWLDFEHGGEGVFIIRKCDIQ